MSRPRSSNRRRPRRGGAPGLLAALLLALAAAVGCAGGPGRPAPATVPEDVATEPPWALPAGSFPTQRLFRLHYESPDGDGALRLVLRLQEPNRYRLTIADRLGRPLYTVDVGAAGGILLDHRKRLVCPLEPDVRLEELPVDPLPLASLPSVLLGRLPAAPAGTEEAYQDRGALAYRDADGRRWTAELLRGWPVAWTLWNDERPDLWWRRSGEEAILSDRGRGLQMTWREVGREPLAEGLGEPSVPAGYDPGVCGPEGRGSI